MSAGLYIRPTSQADWETQYNTIKGLWWDEDRTLTDLVMTMRRDHGFSATPKQYKNMLDKWDLGNNIRAKEMRAIAKIQARRQPKKDRVSCQGPTCAAVQDRSIPEANNGHCGPVSLCFQSTAHKPLSIYGTTHRGFLAAKHL
ncbi:hypothetical protein BJ170DRAFT_233310 [Xylariales sp. AK1849]|nr:hypothetical protein BJ170DRAFT_233310 [Xylariales sp. AK1849]